MTPQARRALLLLGWLTALLLPATPAEAHAGLVESFPAEGAVVTRAPQAITLTFDEPVTVVPARTRVYDATGTTVAATTRSVDEQVVVRPGSVLGPGTYVLVYGLVSADSHPLAGSLTFSVGARSEWVAPVPTSGSPSTPQTLHSVVQGVTLVALLVAVGVALFASFVLPGAEALVRGRLRRLQGTASIAATLGAIALVPLGSAVEVALPDLIRSGDVLFAVLVLGGLTVCAVAVDGQPPTSRGRLAATFGIGLASAAPAAAGHTRAFGPGVLVIGSDVVHVLAGAAWVGGLVALALTLGSLRGVAAARVVARFSQVAGGLLVLVGAAGVLLGWRILGSWSALTSSEYGALLLAKVALVTVVFALAAWNRFRLVPRVRDSGTTLRRTVLAEAGVLVVVLVVTGFLVSADPRSSRPLAKRTDQTVVDGVPVAARIGPGQLGTNSIVVQVGSDPAAVPSVSVASAGLDLGARPVRRTGPGRFRSAVVLPRPGTWTVLVRVRTSEFDEALLTLRAVVPG